MGRQPADGRGAGDGVGPGEPGDHNRAGATRPSVPAARVLAGSAPRVGALSVLRSAVQGRARGEADRQHPLPGKRRMRRASHRLRVAWDGPDPKPGEYLAGERARDAALLIRAVDPIRLRADDDDTRLVLDVVAAPG